MRFKHFGISLLVFLLSASSGKGQSEEKARKDSTEEGLRNAVGIELLGRGFTAFTFSYRKKMGEGARHWGSVNLAPNIFRPSELSLATSYSYIPLKFRSFRLKTGVGFSHLFAFWKEPGAPVDPARYDRPFYQWVAFGEIGLHFTLSERFSLEGTYAPIYYGSPFYFGEGIGYLAPWGGIQLNYRF